MILARGIFLLFYFRYFEPIRSIIYKYDEEISRSPNQFEVDLIIAKCRYNPRVSMG